MSGRFMLSMMLALLVSSQQEAMSWRWEDVVSRTIALFVGGARSNE
jgi:hypothetical protein